MTQKKYKRGRQICSMADFERSESEYFIVYFGSTCPCADLELVCEEDDTFDGIVKRWYVKCDHRDACDFMETKTIQRLKGAQNDIHMP